MAIEPFSVEYPVLFTSGGDTTSQAFHKHIQEIERIYGILNDLNAKKLSASDLGDSVGEISSKLQEHIDSTNPHPNWKPSVSWSELTGTKPALNSFSGTLPVNRISGLTEAIKEKLPEDNGSGIKETDFSQNGYAEFGNGLIIQWGRLTLTLSDYDNATHRYGEDDYPITFARAFRLVCYTVTVGTEINTTDNEHAEVVFQTKNKTTTGCILVPQVFYGSTSGFVNWSSIHANYIAIGV